MKALKISGLLALVAVFGATSLSAGLLDRNDNMERPTGVKIGRRMTLRPYVSLSATYDSNVGSKHGDQEGDVYWSVNPNLSLDYQGDSWSALLSGYYNYHAYCQKHEGTSDGNQHSYGENLRINWSSSSGNDRGWSLMLMQSYTHTSQADDLSTASMRGYNEDNSQIQFGVGLQKRFTESVHGDINASYYMMDYDNTDSTVSAYGWQRWTAGAEAGYAPSKWMDLLLTGSYQGYIQDNAQDSLSRMGRDIGRDSQGYTAQVGFGSYATERISYRLLAGWSRFEYGSGASSDDGFVYTASGSWTITDTWSTMLMASAYYQPSEYEYASASRVDALSWGLSKSLVRNKLRATLDITYRHQTYDHVQGAEGSSYVSNPDYSIDEITGRLGVNYTLNRFLGCFAYGEYIRSFNGESDTLGGYNDYDRWRVTLGLSLTY